MGKNRRLETHRVSCEERDVMEMCDLRKWSLSKCDDSEKRVLGGAFRKPRFLLSPTSDTECLILLFPPQHRQDPRYEGRDDDLKKKT